MQRTQPQLPPGFSSPGSLLRSMTRDWRIPVLMSARAGRLQRSCCSTATVAAAWQHHARRWWSEQHQQQADSAAKQRQRQRRAPAMAALHTRSVGTGGFIGFGFVDSPRPPFFEGMNCQDLGGSRSAEGCRSISIARCILHPLTTQMQHSAVWQQQQQQQQQRRRRRRVAAAYAGQLISSQMDQRCSWYSRESGAAASLQSLMFSTVQCHMPQGRELEAWG